LIELDINLSFCFEKIRQTISQIEIFETRPGTHRTVELGELTRLTKD
jgi:hypothetical protein